MKAKKVLSNIGDFFKKGFEPGLSDTSHIDVLDGIRAIAVIIVAMFHFWQQSWLWGLIPADLLSKFGIENFSENYIYATGYQFVDMMILLSGFCLFLPYARSMVENKKLPSVSRFYARRVARILPSYYFNILIVGAFFAKVSDFGSKEAFFKDLFSHLTFTQMFSVDTYLYTRFNGVLWTVCVEMLFYLIFPLVAFCFRKKPIITYFAMCACSWAYYLHYVRNAENLSMVINQFPTFLCVYANGMMLALIFVNLANTMKQNKYTCIFFTGLSLAGIYMIRLAFKYGLNASKNGQLWQIQNRFLVSILFSIFIIGTCFSFRFYRAIFGNRIMRFLSTISFNLYIWHQVIAIHLKNVKFPYWEAENGLPQMSAGREWQIKYTICIWVASLVIATLVTYFLEKPLDKVIMKGYNAIIKKYDENKSKRKALN